jgi:hypothetical protein
MNWLSVKVPVDGTKKTLLSRFEQKCLGEVTSFFYDKIEKISYFIDL